ncbi:MAG: methyltransferase family protein [Steroidobacteraceae bacterium]
MLRPGPAIVALWVAFWISWMLAAGWSAKVESVRHPIYTGLLIAVYATAAAKGTILGVHGALPVTVGLWMKARLEEKWLRQELDPCAYDAYRSKVPMLVPFGPR